MWIACPLTEQIIRFNGLWKRKQFDSIGMTVDSILLNCGLYLRKEMLNADEIVPLKS
jgi:hypothetical protein